MLDVKTWMVETPTAQEGARAKPGGNPNWQSVKSDNVKVESGALRFENYDGTNTLILAPGTWLSVHDDDSAPPATPTGREWAK